MSSDEPILLKRQRLADHYDDKPDTALISTNPETTFASHKVEPALDKRSQAIKQAEQMHRSFLEQINTPLKLDQFEKMIEDLLKTVPEEKELSLKTLQDLERRQKEQFPDLL